ncbi:MAG: 16S rRNA (cytidine(1402)-2'-O)-methyltransferase [Bacteroidales bacterium]|nr:16S rRNA (cytidine(1402)-2'-O)-methyltransferase [Bacteroidales bacterium]
MNDSGRLILVPTPIGNLGDITLRAIETLKNADILLAEDTRVSSKLLKHFGIDKKLTSHHKFNEHKSLPGLISRLKNGSIAALISDAGTPGISDPGFLLVRACIENGIEVECLPGPTALIPALAVSGLPADRFVFEGFLPQKKGRQKRVNALADESRTMIFYESPFRLVKLLKQLSDAMGQERRACVCRELSKFFEEIKRGTLAELQQYYDQHPPKGEIVVVVEGR